MQQRMGRKKRSPILANLVMTTLIKSSLSKLEFPTPFLFHYVDDILLALPYDRTRVDTYILTLITTSEQIFFHHLFTPCLPHQIAGLTYLKPVQLRASPKILSLACRY